MAPPYYGIVDSNKRETSKKLREDDYGEPFWPAIIIVEFGLEFSDGVDCMYFFFIHVAMVTITRSIAIGAKFC